jgi:hypothetical protein
MPTVLVVRLGTICVMPTPLPEFYEAAPGVQIAYTVLADHVEGLLLNTPRVAVTVPSLEQLDVHDVLVAYLLHWRSFSRGRTESSENGRPRRYHSDLQRMVGRTFATALQLDATPALHAFIDVATHYPDLAIALALAVGGSNPEWPVEVADTAVAGRVPKEVYDLAKLDHYLPRVEYLIRQIRRQRNFPTSQYDLAVALADEWEGTLDELLETTQTLHETIPA